MYMFRIVKYFVVYLFSEQSLTAVIAFLQLFLYEITYGLCSSYKCKDEWVIYSIRSQKSEILNYILSEKAKSISLPFWIRSNSILNAYTLLKLHGIRCKQTNLQLPAHSCRLLFLSKYRLSSLPYIRLTFVSNL